PRRWRPRGHRHPRRTACACHPHSHPRCGVRQALAAIILQTARLSLKGGGGAFVGLVFFLAVVTAVPFAVGPDLKLLARIGPAILMIGALLATLLNLDRLFRDDRDDGSLDLLIMADVPLELTVLAKCAGAWLATALPLVVA